MTSRLCKSAIAVVAAAGLAFGAVGCSSKPSKEAVQEGFAKGFSSIFTEQGAEMGMTSEEFKPYTDCVINEVYDKLSTDSLKILAEGNFTVETKFDEADDAALGEASSNCMSSMPTPSAASS